MGSLGLQEGCWSGGGRCCYTVSEDQAVPASYFFRGVGFAAGGLGVGFLFLVHPAENSPFIFAPKKRVKNESKTRFCKYCETSSVPGKEYHNLNGIQFSTLKQLKPFNLEEGRGPDQDLGRCRVYSGVW